MSGLFENLFDFNHDGKLDSFEQAVRFTTFASFLDKEEAGEKIDELEMFGLDLDDYDEF